MSPISVSGAGGGAPTGPAGGVLGGTYPNPAFAADMATQAELDAHAALASGVHGERQAKKSADQTASVTALADVTDLAFSVAASTDYAFDFWIAYQTDATTTGIGLAINGPASPTLVSYTADISGFAGDSGNSTYHGMGTALDDAIVSGSVANAATIYVARLWGLLRNGATAGTLALRVRSEIGGSVVTVHQGSWGRIWTT